MTGIDTASIGQVNTSAAEVYEDFFVPALFEQWPDRVLDAAGVTAGDAVLDVGCGTGALARAAARRLDGNGLVSGADINSGMLAVARRGGEPISWHEAPAEQLPFDNDSFDCVVSQFALMFFADQTTALQEMKRVARPTGRVVVATWVDVAESPGYAAMVRLLQRLFGDDAANALLAPFTLGTAAKIRAAASSVFADVTVTRHEGEARFESLEAWVHTDVRGWTLDDMIDDDQFAELMHQARVELAQFVTSDGIVRFAAPALIATLS